MVIASSNLHSICPPCPKRFVKTFLSYFEQIMQTNSYLGESFSFHFMALFVNFRNHVCFASFHLSSFCHLPHFHFPNLTIFGQIRVFVSKWQNRVSLKDLQFLKFAKCKNCKMSKKSRLRFKKLQKTLQNPKFIKRPKIKG
jgi:hypothetical protein